MYNLLVLIMLVSLLTRVLCRSEQRELVKLLGNGHLEIIESDKGHNAFLCVSSASSPLHLP